MLNLQQLDALIGSLNTKGIRERALKQQLEKFYDKIRYAAEVYPQIYFILLDFVLWCCDCYSVNSCKREEKYSSQ
jgi:hypothetical protein